MASRHQKKEESDIDSFVGFDREDRHSSVDMETDDDVDIHLDDAVLEKDSDEEELERLVLGNKAGFRERLFRDDFLTADSTALVKGPGDDATDPLKHGHLNDDALFAFDIPKPSGGNKTLEELEKDGDGAVSQDAPAWEDSDDERLTVSLAGATRLRKLRATEAEDLVSGSEYSKRLRQQYLRLYPLPEWAAPTAGGRPSKSRRRRSSASRAASSDASSDDSDEDESLDDALPLETFLRDANSFNGTGARKRRKLRPETIDIQRTRDVPDVHKAPVSSLTFHPRHPVILSSSTSSIMYLHQFAPTAHPTPNPALTSVQVKSTDLRRTAFLGPDGDEIIFAGRRRYFHAWNLATGVVRRVSQIHGHQKEQRTMEHFRLSPCGRYMALVSSQRKGGGMLNVLSVATMQWIAQVRPNGRHGVADFAWWSNGEGLTVAGRDGQVTEWSMAAKRTVGVWRDEGSIGGTVLSLGGRGGPDELGGDRWVAVGSTSGILNVYDRNQLLEEKKEGGETEVKKLPTPVRTFEQLTTAITVATFAPDGQLLAFGSLHKKDALRLVHLPSCTVYRNWPTEQTPLGRVTAVAFDAGSEVLAVGNDQGKVRMWEIRD